MMTQNCYLGFNVPHQRGRIKNSGPFIKFRSQNDDANLQLFGIWQGFLVIVLPADTQLTKIYVNTFSRMDHLEAKTTLGWMDGWMDGWIDVQ